MEYAQAVEILGHQALGHPKIVVTPTGLLIDDASHGPHDEAHPDDGSTSQFALDLAAAMQKLGIVSQVRRLE